MKRLKEANLTINFEKCEFYLSSLRYLGFLIDGEGLGTDPCKVTAMLNYPQSQTVTELDNRTITEKIYWLSWMVPKIHPILF